MPLPDLDSANCISTPPAMDDPSCGVSSSTGEVEAIFISKQGVTAVDVTDFVNAIDNTAATDAAIVKIPCSGSWPEPTRSTQVVEGGATIYGKYQNSITATTYNFTEANYSAARTITYRNKSFAIWFLIDGYIYGGEVDVEDGIIAPLAITPVAEGQDSFAYFKLDFTWQSDTLPSRIANPGA